MGIYDIFAPLYSFLDLIFGWLFKLTKNQEFNTMFGILVMAIIISAIITLITSKVVDQATMKKHKEKMKLYQERLRIAQKKKNVKEMKKIQSKLMKAQSYMMKNSFKPMMYSMVPIILIFGWLNSTFPRDEIIVTLPFSLPHWGTTLGWFGWYILCSFATSILIKKILRVEGP